MGLAEHGLTLPTGSEILDSMIDEYEALTGLTVDRTRTDDQVVMIFATILATQVGEMYDLLQAMYDGTNVEAAIGKQLEDAAYMTGLEPKPATKSTVALILSGVSGTVIPEGSIVEGGGPDGDSRWVPTSDVTLSGISVTVTGESQSRGAITAEPGDIDKIVTAIPGWSIVTNGLAATPGVKRESDASIRARRRASLQASGSASTSAIRASLLDLDYVESVVILENNSNAKQEVVTGWTLEGNSVWIFVHPDTLASDQNDEVAKTIHLKLAAGTETMFVAGPSDVQRFVTDVGGITKHEVNWHTSVSLEADFTVTVTRETGYELADVEQAIEDAMSDFFDEMELGQTLREYDLMLATQGIPGIDGLSFGTLLIDAGPESFPYDPDIDGFLTLGTVTVV